MTIDEAIRHCEEKEQSLLKRAEGLDDLPMIHSEQEEIKNCYECANAHHQLADWLKELKELKAKEIPTPPKTITRYGMGNEYHDYICPNCETFLCYEPEGRSRKGNTRCPQCGQIIEWNP